MVNKIIKGIERQFVGKRDVIEKVVAVLLAGGHILIEDIPGVGKTTLAKSLANCISCGFTRIQFTPDTLPSDVTGMSIYNMATGKFETVMGAIMNNIIMADEINRTSPKTQASFLEAMQEGQVTIDGKKFDLPRLFMVIATQNPVELAGTYVLPEAQLDRFMMRVSIGYPEKESEELLIKKALVGDFDALTEPVVTETDVLYLKQETEKVIVGDAIISYAMDIAKATRNNSEIILGASPRAVIALIKVAKAMAFIAGRDYVLPDDVKNIAPDVLAHRLVFAPVVFSDMKSETEYVAELVNSVSIPDGMKIRKN